MHKTLHRLPSLDFLRGFEAAGRRLSFTRAAEELFLTQSALSRQVKALEDALGVSLFERRHRALALTPAGRAFHQAVSGQLQGYPYVLSLGVIFWVVVVAIPPLLWFRFRHR